MTDNNHALNYSVPGKMLVDTQEFETPSYQRAYQYLKRHDRGQNLDDFTYEQSIEDTHAECLEVITK